MNFFLPGPAASWLDWEAEGGDFFFISVTYPTFNALVLRIALLISLSLNTWHAGVVALIILISYPDQINDIVFGQEGALKGLYNASRYSLFNL